MASKVRLPAVQESLDLSPAQLYNDWGYADVYTGKVTPRVRDDSKKPRIESSEDGKSGQRATSTLGNSVFSWHNSSRATSMLADPIDSSTSRGDETPPSPPASYAYIPGSRLRSSPPLTTEELWAASGL